MTTALSAGWPYEDLRAGWQKVADLRRMSVHVFRMADGRVMAVTNRAQGLGEYVETISPPDAAVTPEIADDVHGLGAVPGRTSHESVGE